MGRAIDLIYRVGLGITSPAWALHPRWRAKVLDALRTRSGESRRISADVWPANRVVLIHAVSVGEMNATRRLVDELAGTDPSLRFYVTATTQTGVTRAAELYAGVETVRVGRFPLDFLASVRRTLDNVRPSAVVLVELELWPNFMGECRARGIPVVVVNGRMTAASIRGYRWMGPVSRRMFAGLVAAGVQDEVNRQRFAEAGVPADRISITGTMKFDTATLGDVVPGADVAAAEVGLKAGEPVWVAGSTGPGEESIVLAVYARLRQRVPGLRLVVVPRKPERFDEVAQQIARAGHPLVRRSRPPAQPDAAAVILIDTMGELRKFYSLATAVFVGRTLADLGPKQHGSDMIEPAALGRVPVVGPFTGNFADAMGHLRAGNAVLEVKDEAGLEVAVLRLLTDESFRRDTGRSTQAVVASQRGATARNAGLLLSILGLTDAK